MENSKPNNIFVQIMMAQKITNDNIVTLADNLKAIADQLERIEKMMAYDASEPTASGAEITPGTIGGQTTNRQNYGM